MLRRGAEVRVDLMESLPKYTDDDLDELDDAPDAEVEEAEEQVVDQASAARTIKELQIEIGMLKELEDLAYRVRQSGTDRKWDELSRLLQNNSEMFDTEGHRRKLVVFSEHRDTLNYLYERTRDCWDVRRRSSLSTAAWAARNVARPRTPSPRTRKSKS